MFCKHCGARVEGSGKCCANCGALFAWGKPTRDPLAPGRLTKIKVGRLGVGDLIAFSGTALLLVSLFLPWYALPGISGGSISALGNGAGGWRFLMLLMSSIILVYLFARSVRRTGFRLFLPHWQLLTVLCTVNLLLALVAIRLKPDEGVTVAGVSIDLAYGAYMALAGGAFAAVGSVMRRTDPEVIPQLPDHSSP